MAVIDQNLTYCPGSFIHPVSGERLMCPKRLSCARYTYSVSLFYPDHADMMLEDGVYDVRESACVLYKNIKRNSMWFPGRWF